MEKENFRVLLDLSDLEDRVYKYVWMLISTIDLKCVADFKNAVIKKLALDRHDIKMFINGGLLLEDEKIMILRENDTVQIQYEKLSNSICHNSSSYMEMNDSKLLLNTEDCNGSFNEIVKRSKKHKKKSEVFASNIADENKDKDFGKHKRKRDVTTDAALEECQDEVLVQVEDPMNSNVIKEEGIFNVKKKKHKKSCSTSTEKDVIQNESSNNNNEEINAMLLDVSATVSLEESLQERTKVEENSPNKPTDVAVESFIQGSNCKKRKRKRRRKKTVEQNLVSSFVSENINTSFKSPKDNPPIFEPCDNFAGIRKHIRFTSPTLDSNTKEIETVDLEICSSDSQIEIVPTEPCISPNAKPSAFPTRKMYLEHANHIANKVYSKCSTSPNNIPLPNAEISSFDTRKTYIVNETTPKLSSKACITTSSETLLASTNTTIGNIANSTTNSPKISTPSKQESLAQNYWVVPPVQMENGNKSYVQASINKEYGPRKGPIHSYADYPLLKALPLMGTHVAFKLLELDENYSPEVSKYKEGVIKSINPKTDELEIDLINLEIKPGRIGKFENLNEDEIPSDEVISTVITPWSALIEPRLISHT